MRFFPIYQIELVGCTDETKQRIGAMMPLFISPKGYATRNLAENALHSATEKIASILGEAQEGVSLRYHLVGMEIAFGTPVAPPQAQQPTTEEDEPESEDAGKDEE